ncbi:MAG: hypothetical protein JW969_04620 [Spirochaetales bacterium]|nr:hypothetical protein [Spirochaetales bacterium]
MDNRKLKVILDYILNRATDEEVSAIKKAVEMRGFSPEKTNKRKTMKDKAKETANMVQNQLEIPKAAIHKMVKDMVTKIIKNNAPEITDEQLNTLLSEWVKNPEETEKVKSLIPGDALLTMVTQFVAFSTGKLDKNDEAQLRKSMPDWPEKYWDAFPEQVRKLVSQYLKAQMDGRQFWIILYQILGIEKKS